MTVGPFILALCLETGVQYNEACKVALEQAAIQSGVEARARETTRKLERSTLEFINAPETVQTALGTTIYVLRLASGQQASFSIPHPLKEGVTTLSVGGNGIGIAYRWDF